MGKTRIHGNSQVGFYADFMVVDEDVPSYHLHGDILLDLLALGTIGSGARFEQSASLVGNKGLIVTGFSRCYGTLAYHLNSYRLEMQVLFFLGPDQCRYVVKAQHSDVIQKITSEFNFWYKQSEMLYGGISEPIRLPDNMWQIFLEGMKAEKDMFTRTGIRMIWADVNTIGIVFSKFSPITNVKDVVHKISANGFVTRPSPFSDQSINVLGSQHHAGAVIADTASSNSYAPGIPNYMYTTFTGLQSTLCDIKSKNSATTSWSAGLPEEYKPSAVKPNPPDVPDRSKIPRSWSKFARGEITRANILSTRDPEYKDTERYFIESMGAESTQVTVLDIGRIENPAMYKSYQVQYVYVTENNPDGTTIERRLWHGTSADTISEINTNGFNRSFCGKNGTVYGRGVYFARYASYSNRYAKPDDDGLRHMYLCKVLTGQFTRGEPSQRVAPPKDPVKPSVKFDSVVNDVTDPEIFVVFSDFRAYPEYLITYKFSG